MPTFPNTLYSMTERFELVDNDNNLKVQHHGSVSVSLVPTSKLRLYYVLKQKFYARISAWLELINSLLVLRYSTL